MIDIPDLGADRKPEAKPFESDRVGLLDTRFIPVRLPIRLLGGQPGFLMQHRQIPLEGPKKRRVAVCTVLDEGPGSSDHHAEDAAQLGNPGPSPARLLHQDATTGLLEVGKFADLVVIDQDITELPADQIDSARSMATLLQGEAIYDPEGIFAE